MEMSIKENCKSKNNKHEWKANSQHNVLEIIKDNEPLSKTP